MTHRIGGYVRDTRAARTDMIGRVEAHITMPGGRPGLRITVPGWQADGYPLVTVVAEEDAARSSVLECKIAAAARGWPVERRSY